MKNSIFSRVKLLVAACVVMSAFALMGCQQPTSDTVTEYVYITPLENTDGIIGTWVSTFGEKFVITNTDFKNEYNNSVCYAGDNLLIMKTGNDSGYLYIKYTTPYNSSDNGKWYAVRYTGLTNTSVILSGAYKSDGVSSTATLSEAVTTFTVANGYFAGSSNCTKQ